jgi:DNA-binding response OmpR family regulator
MARVMIVEDDADLLRLLAIRLRKAGHDVVEEADSSIALDLMRLDRPDAVILDWMMPLLSGVELSRQIRREPGLERVPVLMLTAKSSAEDAEEAQGAGVDAFLSKPCSAAELLNRLDAVIEAKGRLRDFSA